uniref:Large ribosomal subunit protein bL35c n=1 Tax=Plagiogramma staurophorum TaxID=1003089 RepID=A0A2U9NMH3_9STRA|nr:ribosomal protein L35 [Plagiogramma staurophorum]YP_009495921.1 ribosomal protein L35 [Plagiogramma staurophorum]AWT38297.1 ribosomal protein L35 [Plagiogramma staurophorum]AWT38360.1 ribosomal protein L35 [Plagiogramma staurophorum]
MLKLKTRKAASKRYKITGNNNFLRRHAFKGHLLRKKSNTQKRKLSQTIVVSTSDSKSIKLMLPY